VALVAVNNAASARELEIRWPAELGATRLRDALTGESHQAEGPHLRLTVPPRFGTVLAGPLP
jgi:hypothetical protein